MNKGDKRHEDGDDRRYSNSRKKYSTGNGHDHRDQDYEEEFKAATSTKSQLPDSKEHLLKKLAELGDFSEKTAEELYVIFKEVEGTLLKEQKESHHSLVNPVADYSKLKSHFLKVFETILTKDSVLAVSKDLEKRVWIVIRGESESLSSNQKKIHNFNETLTTIVTGNVEMLKNMVSNLRKICNVAEEGYNLDNPLRRIVANLDGYIAELLIFREKHTRSTEKTNLTEATRYALSSLNTYPYEGKYYLLMSYCAEENSDWFSAIYYSIRAYCCERGCNALEMKEKLQFFFEESRKTYLSITKNGFASKTLKNEDLFKYFVMFFLRYQNILFTRIGYEELDGVGSVMLQILKSYMRYLKDGNLTSKDAVINHKKETNCLNYIILMIIFSCYNALYRYNGNETKERKSLPLDEYEKDELTRECLRYSYAIISMIFENAAQLITVDDSYYNLFLPILYFLHTARDLQVYFEKNYPGFSTLLNKIFTQLVKDPSMDTEITNIHFLLPFDKFLLGFLPLKEFFEKMRGSLKVSKTETSKRVLFFMLRELGCEEVDENAGKYPEDEEVKDEDLQFDHHLVPIALKASNVDQTKEKTLIVLDGQNVAVRHGGERFSSEGLKIAIDFWLQRGHPVQVILPDFCFHREEVQKRLAQAEATGEKLKNVPDDVDKLLHFKQMGIAFGIPNWNYDDSYIIDYAQKKGAFIVTNDRYNDHIDKFSKNSAEKRRQLKNWIRGSCISFSFIGDEFLPNPDFLNTHNIK